MINNFNLVFLGVSKSVQKKFYYDVLKSAEFKKVIIPCCGTFALVKSAIEAGYKKENIICSDISLFTSLLGCLFSGRSISDLKLEITNEDLRESYEKLDNDIDRVCELIWFIKTKQLNPDKLFERTYYNDLVINKADHLNRIKKTLLEMVESYSGIKFEVDDMRNQIEKYDEEGNIFLLHPPAYEKGYSKQFKIEDAIQFPVLFQEFSFKKEVVGMYLASKEKKALYVWSIYKDLQGIPAEDKFFVEQRSAKQFEYFCVTKPEIIKDSKFKNKVELKKRKVYEPLNCKIIPENYVIRRDSIINVVKINENNALYYRDLWAHKMGQTKAEQYFGVFVDGMIFGVTGLHLSDVFRLRSTDVFEVFGFDQRLENHFYFHKLFMMILVCEDFKRTILYHNKKNRIWDLKGFKTACITKYRKLKSSVGILDLVSREKLDNGNYHLMYRTDFHKRTFRETLEYWYDNFANVTFKERSKKNEGTDSEA